MTIELARRRLIAKPWGARDLGPWDQGADDGSRVGEIWYERLDGEAAPSSLLLKLLFVSEQLSIQVHPDDEQARSMGLACGKTEAWYILSAAPGAQVALGLRRSLSKRHLRDAANDGSLAKLIAWRSVWPGDTIFVAAGTIHSISAGIVLAEIQQRSDTTFRLFDPGRDRELHIENAIDVARAEPASEQRRPRRLGDERMLLVSDPHFILERLDLPGDCERCLDAESETWLLVVSGVGRVGSFEVGPGSVVFASSDRAVIRPGADGLVCLVAYTGSGRPVSRLFCNVDQASAAAAGQISALLPT